MTPKYKITANDTDITDLISARLISISITDEIGLTSDSATIELDDRDEAFAIPECGATLEIALGYDDDLYSMGVFIVDEVEIKAPPQTIIITARSANSALGDMGSFRVPKSYSWDKYTLVGIVETIAARYGLTASIADTYSSILVDHIDQTGESDCAFIQRVANEYAASVKIAGGKLLFIDPMTGMFPNGTSLPTTEISELATYNLRISQRNAYGSVTAKYYDFDAATEKEITAGTASPVYTIRDTYTNATHAGIMANAKLAELITGTYALNIDMIGNALLCAESVIELTTGHSEIQGSWVVKSASHRFSVSGYRTSIQATKIKGGNDE